MTVADLVSTQSEGGDGRGVVPGVDACRSAPFRPIVLPADDAPHDDTYLEFWQWPISVETADGRRLAFFMTFENKPWARIGLAQFTVTDVNRRTFAFATEKLPRHPQTLPGGFSIDGENVEVSGGAGVDRIRFRLAGYNVNLTVRETKPPVIQLGDGHFTAYCNDFHLYSRYRMAVTGTVSHDGRTHAVTGTSSYDHLWGFYPAIMGGKTIALKLGLDDGRDIFVGIAKTAATNAFTLKFGAISDKHGRVTQLHRGDFVLRPGRRWRRDATCSYPVEWDLTIGRERFHTRPVVDAAELTTSDPSVIALWPEFPAYWDGEIVTTGRTRGRGWLDLTHYCAA